MPITYEEALSTLGSMFGPPWTTETLDSVLRHFEGHMENTVECILAHGDGSPQALVDRLASGGKRISADEEIARQLMSDAQISSSSTTRTTTTTTTTSGGGSSSSGPATAAPQGGRGKVTELPADFLRIPGYESSGTGGMASLTGVDADEALARMLQDELFTQELANNPEFAHLAGMGGGGGRRGSSSNRWTRTAATASGGRGPGGPFGGGGGGGVAGGLFGFPFPGRGTPPPGTRPGPGAPAAGPGGAAPDGPSIVDKLADLGENTKKRLAIFAAQWNARNQKPNTSPLSGGGLGGSSGAAFERRGLLDGDGDDDDDDTDGAENIVGGTESSKPKGD